MLKNWFVTDPKQTKVTRSDERTAERAPSSSSKEAKKVKEKPPVVDAVTNGEKGFFGLSPTIVTSASLFGDLDLKPPVEAEAKADDAGGAMSAFSFMATPAAQGATADTSRTATPESTDNSGSASASGFSFLAPPASSLSEQQSSADAQDDEHKAEVSKVGASAAVSSFSFMDGAVGGAQAAPDEAERQAEAVSSSEGKRSAKGSSGSSSGSQMSAPGPMAQAKAGGHRRKRVAKKVGYAREAAAAVEASAVDPVRPAQALVIPSPPSSPKLGAGVGGAGASPPKSSTPPRLPPREAAKETSGMDESSLPAGDAWEKPPRRERPSPPPRGHPTPSSLEVTDNEAAVASTGVEEQQGMVPTLSSIVGELKKATDALCARLSGLDGQRSRTQAEQQRLTKEIEAARAELVEQECEQQRLADAEEFEAADALSTAVEQLQAGLEETQANLLELNREEELLHTESHTGREDLLRALGTVASDLDSFTHKQGTVLGSLLSDSAKRCEAEGRRIVEEQERLAIELGHVRREEEHLREEVEEAEAAISAQAKADIEEKERLQGVRSGLEKDIARLMEELDLKRQALVEAEQGLVAADAGILKVKAKYDRQLARLKEREKLTQVSKADCEAEAAALELSRQKQSALQAEAQAGQQQFEDDLNIAGSELAAAKLLEGALTAHWGDSAAKGSKAGGGRALGELQARVVAVMEEVEALKQDVAKSEARQVQLAEERSVLSRSLPQLELAKKAAAAAKDYKEAASISKQVKSVVSRQDEIAAEIEETKSCIARITSAGGKLPRKQEELEGHRQKVLELSKVTQQAHYLQLTDKIAQLRRTQRKIEATCKPASELRACADLLLEMELSAMGAEAAELEARYGFTDPGSDERETEDGGEHATAPDEGNASAAAPESGPKELPRGHARELQELQERLDAAVAEEDFEQAALIQDQITSMEDEGVLPGEGGLPDEGGLPAGNEREVFFTARAASEQSALAARPEEHESHEVYPESDAPIPAADTPEAAPAIAAIASEPEAAAHDAPETAPAALGHDAQQEPEMARQGNNEQPPPETEPEPELQDHPEQVGADARETSPEEDQPSEHPEAGAAHEGDHEGTWDGREPQDQQAEDERPALGPTSRPEEDQPLAAPEALSAEEEEAQAVEADVQGMATSASGIESLSLHSTGPEWEQRNEEQQGAVAELEEVKEAAPPAAAAGAGSSDIGDSGASGEYEEVCLSIGHHFHFSSSCLLACALNSLSHCPCQSGMSSQHLGLSLALALPPPSLLCARVKQLSFLASPHALLFSASLLLALPLSATQPILTHVSCSQLHTSGDQARGSAKRHHQHLWLLVHDSRTRTQPTPGRRQ
ncbi:unnamed protein product [Chrysoparadoxa australica]